MYLPVRMQLSSGEGEEGYEETWHRRNIVGVTRRWPQGDLPVASARTVS
jgi:hypothetical protein